MNRKPAAPSAGARGALRRHWLAAVLGTLAAIATVCAATSPTQSGAAPGGTAHDVTYELHGFLSLTGPSGVLVSTSETIDRTDDPVCWGQSQYQDIGYGSPITVYNDQDAIVAYGALGRGRIGRLSQPPNAGCVFPFVVKDVPARSAFYQVEVASRGTVQVTTPAEDGVLYAYVGLDDKPGSLPAVADQPPRIPTVVR